MHTNKPEVILVTGSLTNEKVLCLSKQSDRAITRLQNQETPAELIFVIDSFGGIFSPALESLIAKIRTAKTSTVAKIYQAHSAAAMLALACARREITDNGNFGLHNGRMEISTADVKIDDSGQGVLSPPVHENLQSMRRLNQELMEANHLKLTGPMSDCLSATGVLLLNAKDCVEVGIAERIV